MNDDDLPGMWSYSDFTGGQDEVRTVKRPKIYTSGPMSGLPDNNFPAFQAVSAELRAAGYAVEDPSDKGIVDGWSWEDYLRWDLAVLVKCDQVATLPGWTRSRGARLEVRVAKALGMPVRPWKELLP